MTVPGWLTARPIAHRGVHDDTTTAENTLAAFGRAVELGAPFEFDVQLTSDGHPVVMHDRDLSRVVGHPTAPLTELELAAVRRLRLVAGGEPVPTLDEVLALVGGAVPVVVDVRRWRVGGDAALERAVADRLRRYDGQAVLQSFDPLAVFRLRRLLPGRAVGQISGALVSAGPVVGALGRTMVTNLLARPRFLVYELSELPSPAVSFWRRRGLPVVAFSTRSAADEVRALALADNFFFSGYVPACYLGPT